MQALNYQIFNCIHISQGLCHSVTQTVMSPTLQRFMYQILSCLTFWLKHVLSKLHSSISAVTAKSQPRVSPPSPTESNRHTPKYNIFKDVTSS